MRDAKLADLNTRMLLKMHEQLTEIMRIIAWDLAKCTPDTPDVSWSQYPAALERFAGAVKTAEQNVSYHIGKKRAKP